MNYSLLCLHTVFNGSEMEAVMGPRTSYVTMLRDPVEVFESQYSFYGFSEFYGLSLGRIQTTLEMIVIQFSAEDFASAPKTEKLLRRKSGQGRNQMLFDLGLDSKDMDNDTKVESKIKEIDDRFNLVMMQESFSESLVLLKEELCWDLDDVTNFKLNGRKKGIKKTLSEETRSRLRDFLKADYKLYNYFQKKFKKKIESYGKEKMKEEVAKLEIKNEEITRECSITPAENQKLGRNQKWWGKNVVGYTTKNSSKEECLLMTMSELAFIDKIRTKQREQAEKIILEQSQLKPN